jgi:hypothetical protein
MRQRLNENPLVQVAVICALAVVVAFLFLSRMGGDSGSSDSTSAAPTTSTVATTAAPTSDATAPAPASAATPPTGAPAGSSDSAPTSPATEFTAGPGLPEPVAQAYAQGKAVVLLIIRERGIDDKKLKAIVETLRSRHDAALFVTNAAGIARYSRIAEGVNVDRTPALVVVRPKSVTNGPMPTATLSYGFRGKQSVDQAVEDALYKGRQDLPFYPN